MNTCVLFMESEMSTYHVFINSDVIPAEEKGYYSIWNFSIECSPLKISIIFIGPLL